jgi:type IV secretion system protein VirD4
MGQLRRCWGEGQEQILLSNTTQIFYGVNDQQTAEYVSNRLGEYTQVVTSGGSNRGGSRSRSTSENGSGSSSHSSSWGESDNWSQSGRRLLKPEEVTNLDPRIAITFTPGVPPIWTWLIRYYEGIPQTQMSLYRVVVDTTCFFLLALMVAVIATAAFNPQLLRSVDVQDFRTSPEPALDAGAFDARWHP